jgi:outer membrane protein insertion porin family
MIAPIHAALLALALAQQQPQPRPPQPPARPPFPPEIVREKAAPPAAGAQPPGPTGPAEAVAVPAQARRYQIERIRFVGLDRVRELEARRHLLFGEGEILDEERVLFSRLKLLQLGWFSRVETRVERGSERGLVVLVIEVVERNTLLVTDLILGSTPPQPVYGGFGLSQQNFLGRGFGLSGAFVYGGSPHGRPADPDRFAVRGGFFAPDVEVPGLRRGLVLGANLHFARGEEFACPDPKCEAFRSDYGAAPVLRYQRAAGEATVGIRPGAFERIHGTLRFERVRAVPPGAGPLPVAGSAAPTLFDGWSTVAALTGTYEMDTRDDFFFPRDGLRALAQITFGSRVLGGDYEYSRYLLSLDTSFSIFRLPLRFQGAVGAAQGNAPFFERFYAADFSYFAVGPAVGRALELNFSTDARYDAFVSMAGLEYAIPLWSGDRFFRRGYLALGVRGVYSTAVLGGARTRQSTTPISADVALRFDTPVGVFNASLGYAVDNAL